MPLDPPQDCCWIPPDLVLHCQMSLKAIKLANQTVKIPVKSITCYFCIPDFERKLWHESQSSFWLVENSPRSVLATICPPPRLRLTQRWVQLASTWPSENRKKVKQTDSAFSYSTTYQKDVFNAKIRLPIFLERVDTNFTSMWDIGMEDFSEKKAFRRTTGEVFTQNHLNSKVATGIWCSSW